MGNLFQIKGAMHMEAHIVKISYKTGSYIGEVVDEDERRALVKVLAVLRHPEQGDLHHPYDPDAAMFHERRALSYTEKVWLPLQEVQSYDGAIPSYPESLAIALGAEMEKLDRLRRWADKGLQLLTGLRKDYGIKTNE
jgi:kinase-associated protein B